MTLDTLKNARVPKGGEWETLTRTLMGLALKDPGHAARVEALVLEPDGQVTATVVDKRPISPASVFFAAREPNTDSGT